ncbi:MAG: hypothetical protein HY926_12795 [Elusimicrobia bacterium]|nr:hypothetical protein [Elusimicrobiota bacterium]
MGSCSRLALIPLLALLLSGCVAETVRKARPRKGTIREIGYVDLGGGEVRYSLDGWGWFVAGRRRAARALMRRVCGKLKPVVTEEFEREDADVPYSQDDIAATMARGAEHFTVARYMHMVFDCAFSSTAPVRGEPPRGLPPPPRPVVEVPAPVAAVSSAPVPAAPVVVVSSVPAPAPAVQFSSAPARPAITAAPPAPPKAAPAAAAVWSPFATTWTPVQAPPQPSTSPVTSEAPKP